MAKFRTVLVFVDGLFCLSERFWPIVRRIISVQLSSLGTTHPIFQFRQNVQFRAVLLREVQKEVARNGRLARLLKG